MDSLPNLIELGRLRAESIKGQLGGTIPSTSDGQNADNSSLIDASSVNLSALGSMGMGGMAEDGEGGFRDGFGGMGDMPDMALMQQAMQIIGDAGDEHELCYNIGNSVGSIGWRNFLYSQTA